MKGPARAGTKRHVPRWVAAVIVASLSIGGCGGDADSESGSPSSTAAGTAAPDQEATDRADVEDAYVEFVRVTWTFDKHFPESRWREVVARVAVEPLVTTVVASATAQKRQGIVLYGQPVPHVTVDPINGADRATLRDCQDARRAGMADAVTKKPRSRGIARTPVIVTLVRGSDGAWRVSEARFPGGACE